MSGRFRSLTRKKSLVQSGTAIVPRRGKWALRAGIVGRPYSHEGLDDGRKIVTVSAAYGDKDGYADKKAEREKT